MKTSSLIGLCRFSFVGRGDWTAYRDPGVDHNSVNLREEIITSLLAQNSFVVEVNTAKDINNPNTIHND